MSEHRIIPGITLANPADAGKYYAGQAVEFRGRVPWWKRLLWWLRILKRPAPVVLEVEEVNYDAGTIGVGLGFCVPHGLDVGGQVHAVTLRDGVPLCASCAAALDKGERKQAR